MSMTLTAAKAYVAKIMGLHNDTNALTIAADAIEATYRKWATLSYWNWTLKDTVAGFTVTTCTVNAGAKTLTPATAGDLDGVNLNVEVALSTNSWSVPDGTTVVSYSRDSSGHIVLVTLSDTPTGGTGTASATFAGDIPLVAGVQEYNPPTDFESPYAARLVANPRLLTYIKYREWNKKVADHTQQGTPECYTVYNPISSGTQRFKRLRVFRIPSTADTLHLQYYRTLDTDSAVIDIWDDYLYVFLDDARMQFLMQKNADDSRLPALMKTVDAALTRVIADDMEQCEDEDVRLMSQMEAPPDRRINYDPFGGDWY
jgi:hypothetical protein